MRPSVLHQYALQAGFGAGRGRGCAPAATSTGERVVPPARRRPQAAHHYLGERLGLYRALAEGGAATSSQLAARTGTTERYVREWLEHHAASAPVARFHSWWRRFGLETRRRLCNGSLRVGLTQTGPGSSTPTTGASTDCSGEADPGPPGCNQPQPGHWAF
jgi:Rv2258c-like winged HTH domain